MAYQNSGGESDVGFTVGDMHVIAIPLYLNIHHRIKRKVEMIYTAGVSGGYLFAERVRNKNYTAEDIPENSLLSGLDQSNVNLFNDYYISADFGVGISTFLKSRVVLVLQPMFKYQVHNARDFGGQRASSKRRDTHGVKRAELGRGGLPRTPIFISQAALVIRRRILRGGALSRAVETIVERPIHRVVAPWFIIANSVSERPDILEHDLLGLRTLDAWVPRVDPHR